jgi:hypothetical protein
MFSAQTSFCNVTQCFLDKKFFDAKFSHVRNQISEVPSKLTKKRGKRGDDDDDDNLYCNVEVHKPTDKLNAEKLFIIHYSLLS